MIIGANRQWCRGAVRRRITSSLPRPRIKYMKFDHCVMEGRTHLFPCKSAPATFSPVATSATTPPNKPPVIPFIPRRDKDVRREVEPFIKDLRKRFKTFLEDNVQLPLWQLPSELAKHLTRETRSHITGLKIPTISSSSQIPSLLLHNLGKPSHDAKLVDRINELFRPTPK